LRHVGRAEFISRSTGCFESAVAGFPEDECFSFSFVRPEDLVSCQGISHAASRLDPDLQHTASGRSHLHARRGIPVLHRGGHGAGQIRCRPFEGGDGECGEDHKSGDEEKIAHGFPH
ncbi:MAG: hypothetical protein ACK55I_13240, partial [bacterium]